MTNLYRQFRALIPADPLLVGDVVSLDPMRVQLPDGSQIAAHGDATLGARVFVRSGAIEGPAPTLPVEIIEI